MVEVSVFMDIEDPVHPPADDAALELVRVFERAGIRGSFCITGEKCRVLAERGRDDLVAALRPHCLGLHTDTHSRHPTTMELLEDLSFEEGCRAALETERRGSESFEALFGRAPAFWGGAGNTWAPEITEALKALGIPAYAYALTQVPGDRIHRFNGVVAFPQHLAVSEDDWTEDASPSVVAQRVLGFLGGRTSWSGVFVGHPTRFRFSSFWDQPFFEGRSPVAIAPLTAGPPAAFDRARVNLGAFLATLRQEAKVVGLDEATPPAHAWRAADEVETEHFRLHTVRALEAAARWPVHHPQLRADGIIAKTLALGDRLELPRD